MTEKQAIKRLKSEMEWESIELNREAFSMGIKALEEIQQYRAIGTVEEIKKAIMLFSNDEDNTIIDDLNLLIHYKLLGTVEELQTLKENQRKCEDCAGCTNWNCDCYNERVMAIEEFTERLITNAESFQAEVNGIMADLMTLDYFMEFVDEIAESMKGEKE